MSPEKRPMLRMVGGDDVEETLSRTAKVSLPDGFEAELSHYIDKAAKGSKRNGPARAGIGDLGAALRLERSQSDDPNDPTKTNRVRVEFFVRDWPKVKAAIEAALAKLAPEGS